MSICYRFLTFSGMNGILAGITVALKQSVPETEIKLFVISIKLKVITLNCQLFITNMKYLNNFFVLNVSANVNFFCWFSTYHLSWCCVAYHCVSLTCYPSSMLFLPSLVWCLAGSIYVFINKKGKLVKEIWEMALHSLHSFLSHSSMSNVCKANCNQSF